MRLQKASLFALYAILELAARPEETLSTGDIAAKYGISTHHLAKVMMPLVRAGFIQSVRGVGGGYRFAGNAGRITLFDVIDLFESVGADQDGEDLRGAKETPVGAALQNIRGEIDALSRATLQSVTLRTLLRTIGQGLGVSGGGGGSAAD